jgi:hypothetical protein
MKKLVFLVTILTAACLNHASQTTVDSSRIAKNEYVWTKLLDSADWKKSYNFQMFSRADALWVFHPDGNWFSTNGINWAKSSLPNAINNLAFLDYIQFNNAMFGLGHFEGNIEKFSFKPEIYKSTDLKYWDIVAKQSNLPTRFFYHPFVFAGKIWIIGGEDIHTQYSDIWNSTDGIHWIKQKDNLPFGKRQHSQVVNLNGKLFLLNNDVWTSHDGLNWQLITNEIVKGVALFGYAALVFDNKIWLIGCNRNEQFSSQVLYSADGINWNTMVAPWSPRGAVAAAVYKNKVYMTGGKYGGTPNNPDFRYSNDVWTLEKKQLP